MSWLCHELELLNIDIFLLQETHVSCKRQAEAVEHGWHEKCFWSFGTGKSAGVAVFLSLNFSGDVQRFVFNSDGCVLSLLLQLNSLKFTLVNIYALTGVSDRKIFFEQLHHHFLS